MGKQNPLRGRALASTLANEAERASSAKPPAVAAASGAGSPEMDAVTGQFPPSVPANPFRVSASTASPPGLLESSPKPFLPAKAYLEELYQATYAIAHAFGSKILGTPIDESFLKDEQAHADNQDIYLFLVTQMVQGGLAMLNKHSHSAVGRAHAVEQARQFRMHLESVRSDLMDMMSRAKAQSESSHVSLSKMGKADIVRLGGFCEGVVTVLNDLIFEEGQVEAFEGQLSFMGCSQGKEKYLARVDEALEMRVDNTVRQNEYRRFVSLSKSEQLLSTIQESLEDGIPRGVKGVSTVSLASEWQEIFEALKAEKESGITIGAMTEKLAKHNIHLSEPLQSYSLEKLATIVLLKRYSAEPVALTAINQFEGLSSLSQVELFRQYFSALEQRNPGRIEEERRKVLSYIGIHLDSKQIEWLASTQKELSKKSDERLSVSFPQRRP